MLTKLNKPKKMLHFLIHKWQLLVVYAAQERVHVAASKYAKANNVELPEPPLVIDSKPCDQISIIKAKIIDILPEAKFINYNYEAQLPLDPEDFVEAYIGDHIICIKRLFKIIGKMNLE